MPCYALTDSVFCSACVSETFLTNLFLLLSSITFVPIKLIFVTFVVVVVFVVLDGPKPARADVGATFGAPNRTTTQKTTVTNVTNVGFSGYNVIDESTKSRFMRLITGGQTDQQGLTVRA